MSRDKGYACNMASTEFEQCILEWTDLVSVSTNIVREGECLNKDKIYGI
jgi:hypothetical protein